MIRWKSLLALVVTVAVILAAAVFSVPVIRDEINLGLDLQGGVYVLLEAQPRDEDPDDQQDGTDPSLWQRFTAALDRWLGRGGFSGGGKISDQDMAGTIAVLRNRVDQFGFAEPIIQREGERRIRVELATDSGDPDQNQRAILEMIGQTALLEFKNAEGETVLTGANLRNASAVYQPDELGRSVPMVSLEFDREGTRIFAELTRTHVGKQVAIVLDGEVISSPVVRSVISDGQAVITGMASIDEAAALASLLRSGALPLELEQLEVRTVGPLLGLDSLQRSLYAGFIGLGLVLLFMLVFYRLPGLLASIALVAYLVILLGVMVAMGAVLTLPGVAGIILTIGMAVDANIIIFERIKEELYNGKTFRASVVAGFRKALSTITDANVTTLIVAGILFRFGTGPVRGFALTLSIGVVVSMITALVITRLMMTSLANSNIVRGKWLLGVNR